MIDVIFLLLVFFIATASFRAVEEVLPTNVRLPGTAAEAAPIDPEIADLDEIVVEVLWEDGQPRWRVQGRQYDRLEDVGAVLAAVARVKNDLPVILDVAGEAPLGRAIDLYDLCRRIGLAKIQFAAAA